MILISPYSRKLRNGKENPKNYPYWGELVKELATTDEIIQIGVEPELKLVPDCRFGLSLDEIAELVSECSVWISVDNFLQHLVNNRKIDKRGVVIWGISDPRLFGYKSNKNIFKNKKYFRPNQFGTWEQAEFKENVFVNPEEVLVAVGVLKMGE